MTSHSSIKEGKRKEVTSKQKRPVTRMAKDYHLPKTSHHLQKSEAKGRGSRFFHIAAGPPTYLLEGSLPPLQLSKLLKKI
jgi:hypothetical protein